MSFSRKRKSRINPYDPKRLFNQLPGHLKTYVDFYYVHRHPDGGHDAYGWRDHDRAVAAWLRERFGSDPNLPRAIDVSEAGGLTQKVWFDYVLHLPVVPGKMPAVFDVTEWEPSDWD